MNSGSGAMVFAGNYGLWHELSELALLTGKRSCQ